jgi:hypothetical protein
VDPAVWVPSAAAIIAALIAVGGVFLLRHLDHRKETKALAESASAAGPAVPRELSQADVLTALADPPDPPDPRTAEQVEADFTAKLREVLAKTSRRSNPWRLEREAGDSWLLFLDGDVDAGNVDIETHEAVITRPATLYFPVIHAGTSVSLLLVPAWGAERKLKISREWPGEAQREIVEIWFPKV